MRNVVAPAEAYKPPTGVLQPAGAATQGSLCMKARNLSGALSVLVFLAGSLATTPTAAISDAKQISPMSCLPRGPNTVASELSYVPSYGITNPGTTPESVVCSILTDGEQQWSSTPATSAFIYVGYRNGAVPGNLACTAFAGTAVDTAAPIYSVSQSPAVSAAYARAYVYLQLADSTLGGYGQAPPVTQLCTIAPKTTMGTIFFDEKMITNE